MAKRFRQRKKHSSTFQHSQKCLCYHWISLFSMILAIFHEIKSLRWLNGHFDTYQIKCHFLCIFRHRCNWFLWRNVHLIYSIHSIAIIIRLTDYRNHIKTLFVLVIDRLLFNGCSYNYECFHEITFPFDIIVLKQLNPMRTDGNTSDDVDDQNWISIIPIQRNRKEKWTHK